MSNLQRLIGQTLGQYKIVEKIGQGGMASIFKAHQPGLNRDIALKILPPYIAEKEGFTERFTREAQAIGNLHHPNILPVYDSGQDRGYGYIAMRYVPNASTLAHLMRTQLATEQILNITHQIAGALDHAHEAGIVHRDIKPSNILMDGDWVMLSDFGLAKMVQSPSELTGTGVGIGTPAYMSPEQAKGEKIDHRTDVYSLGIMLFEMLTGTVPHKAETPLATVVKRINEPLPSPRNLNPDIPESVEQVLLKALTVTPADRYNSAGELAQSLETAFEQVSTAADQDIAIPVPQPADVADSQPARAEAIAVPIKKPAKKSFSAIEIVVMTLLGVVSLCGVSGVFLSFTPNAETGSLNLELAPACLGMLFAGVTSILMLWLRNRNTSASAWLAMGIVMWFLGVNILGWGGFSVLSPGDNSLAENLGFSLALCFAPGGLIALLGLGFYTYDFRRSRSGAKQGSGRVVAAGKTRKARLDKLQRAKEYQASITELIKQKKGSSFINQVAPVAAKLNQWQLQLQQLVNRLNDFETNRIIQRDITDVPAAIERLQKQMERETDPQIQEQMAETLDGYKEHQRQLKLLVSLMRKTELEIDETLASIGAIYSQLQLLDAKDIDSNRAKRLSNDIDEQANRLGDLLHAMDDVYQSSVGVGGH